MTNTIAGLTKTAPHASQLQNDGITYGVVIRRYRNDETGEYMVSAREAGAVARKWAQNRNSRAALTNTEQGWYSFESASYEDRFYTFESK